MANAQQSGLSKEFLEILKSVGESKSKQEEDRIIIHEIGVLKTRVNQIDVTPVRWHFISTLCQIFCKILYLISYLSCSDEFMLV
jgi:hypothetical protein